MNRTRERNAKRTSNSSPKAPSTSSRKPLPQKRSIPSREQNRSKSPKDKVEPKYRVRNTPPTKDEEFLQITESIGDIFHAPPNTLIVHACNCDGSWGAGIAAAFRSRFPKAYEHYKDHCDKHGTGLMESAELIPPVDYFESAAATTVDQEGETPDAVLQFNIPNSQSKAKAAATSTNSVPAKHFIGCLFTSRHSGRRKDSPARILEATAPAMVDLLRQVNKWNATADEGDKVREVRMCKINSGLFHVPWAKTKGVLREIEVGRSQVKEVRVVSPAELPGK